MIDNGIGLLQIDIVEPGKTVRNSLGELSAAR